MVRISERDSSWLLNHFTNESYNKPMRGTVVDDYLSAEKILKGLEKKRKLSCGCNAGKLKQGVDPLYKEFIDAQNNIQETTNS